MFYFMAVIPRTYNKQNKRYSIKSDIYIGCFKFLFNLIIVFYQHFSKNTP